MSTALTLALAAHIVTVAPSELGSKPVLVRIGLHPESRLTLPEPLRRVHGRPADAEAVGLVVSQTQPRAVLSFRPRRAATARFLILGRDHSMELVVEATTTGAAQDVELRIRAPEPAAPPPMADAAAVPPPARPDVITPATPASVPSSPPSDATVMAIGHPRSPSADDPPRADAALADDTPAAPATQSAAQSARACWLTGPPAIRRPQRRIARPGQHVVIVEEVAREATQVRVRVRVEHAARCARVRRLLIAGVAADVTTAVEGRDLIVMGVAPPPADCRTPGIMLTLDDGRWRSVSISSASAGLVTRVARRGVR